MPRQAYPEGLVGQVWPKTSDSITTSFATFVSCESTQIGSEKSCLDSSTMDGGKMTGRNF